MSKQRRRRARAGAGYFDVLPGHWLDDHHCAIGCQSGIGALRGFGWIAHVVQAIEERDQVVAGQWRWIRAGRDHLERGTVGHASRLAASRARSIDGTWMSKPTKCEFGYALAMTIVDAP